MKIETEDDEEGLLEEIKKIWESDESYEKFHELKKVLLETHANRDDLGTDLQLWILLMSILERNFCLGGLD